MKKDFTEIVAILDRSGSMSQLSEDTIGGFNSFIEQQKEVKGECSVSLILFDDKYDQVYSDLDIKEVPVLTDKEYFARGMTALLDAVGKTINSVGDRLRKTPEDLRPEQVIFIITTDGAENQSTEFRGEQIKEMIKEQTDKYGWEFMFLGANIDAFGVGNSLGMKMNMSAQYDASSVGTQALYSSLSRGISMKRYDKDVVLNMTDEYETALKEETDKNIGKVPTP